MTFLRKLHRLSLDALTLFYLNKLKTGDNDFDHGEKFGLSQQRTSELLKELFFFVYTNDPWLQQIRHLSDDG